MNVRDLLIAHKQKFIVINTKKSKDKVRNRKNEMNE